MITIKLSFEQLQYSLLTLTNDELHYLKDWITKRQEELDYIARNVCYQCKGEGKELVLNAKYPRDSDDYLVAVKCCECNGKGYHSRKRKRA